MDNNELDPKREQDEAVNSNEEAITGRSEDDEEEIDDTDDADTDEAENTEE